MLKIIHLAPTLLVLLLQLCKIDRSSCGEQSLNSDDFVGLSQIRASTIGLPLKLKCSRYESRLRETLAGEVRLVLFAKAVDFLKQRRLMNKNPILVLHELKQCLSQANEEAIEDFSKDNDTSIELRNQLDEARFKIAEQENELRIKQTVLNDANDALRQKNDDIDRLKRSSAKPNAESEDELRVLTSASDQAEVLHKNFHHLGDHCLEYHFMLSQQRPLKVHEIKTIARLDLSAAGTIKFKIDDASKDRINDLFEKSVRGKQTKLSTGVAGELQRCAGSKIGNFLYNVYTSYL